MSTIEIIAKYNQKINDLAKQRKDALSKMAMIGETLTKNMVKKIEREIIQLDEFVTDLQFIQRQMPTINPIEEGNYNDAPEGLKEITLDEWQRGMFHYSLYQSHSKQVRGDQTFDLRLFDVPNFDNKKLGYAIMNDWFDKEQGKNRPKNIVRFCRYGKDSDWTKFEGRFAAQFSGDNS